MDETEILTEVKAGNTIAFERLYDCYWLKVYNFAQLYITSSFEVSEVVQDVFVKVWESREMSEIFLMKPRTLTVSSLLLPVTLSLIIRAGIFMS